MSNITGVTPSQWITYWITELLLGDDPASVIQDEIDKISATFNMSSFEGKRADPLDIIYNKTNLLIGAVKAGNSTVKPPAIDYNEFFVLARSTGIIFLFITAAICLIGMMLTTNSKLVAEKKQSLENTFKLTFLLSSAVTIFSCVKSFFDTLLY
jgi:hypothetical protein